MESKSTLRSPRKAESKRVEELLKKDVLATGQVQVPRIFGAVAVAEILGVKDWRLQKFLSSPQFKLSSSAQSITTSGGRRVFTDLDVLRIGVATYLTEDGF